MTIVQQAASVFSAITTTNVPPVNIITDEFGGIALQYGSSQTNENLAGIYFSFSVTTPTNGTGSFGFLQVVDQTTRRWILDDTNSTAQKSYGTNRLDSIPGGPIAYPQASVNGGETKSLFYYDYPVQYLKAGNFSSKWASADDHFSSYLVYRPAGDTNKTIWVALRKMEWNWSGGATKGTNGVWALDSGWPSPPVNPASVDTDALPIWSGDGLSLPVVPDD